MTTKKLSARQARWAEYLSRYYFKLAYRASKSNERADAFSRKLEDTAAQDRAIAAHCTQILLLRDKITDEVVWNLELTPVEPAVSRELSTNPHQEGTRHVSTEYTSIELIDKLLSANCVFPELEELRAKTRNEKKGTWQLRDRLLLQLEKLYIPDSQLTPEMPLRTALIREAHDQLLMGHSSRAKLQQLLQSCYYWPN
jgi:hypothetical protein